MISQHSQYLPLPFYTTTFIIMVCPGGRENYFFWTYNYLSPHSWMSRVIIILENSNDMLAIGGGSMTLTSTRSLVRSCRRWQPSTHANTVMLQRSRCIISSLTTDKTLEGSEPWRDGSSPTCSSGSFRSGWPTSSWYVLK
jgi:hypothetical protein